MTIFEGKLPGFILPGFYRATILSSAFLFSVSLFAFDILPGTLSPVVEPPQQLLKAYSSKKGSYEMHTEHLNSDGSPRYINRLIDEDSPYLMQHAHNPVDWHAWGDEAFEKAKAENKPIFLSIGYSTCHWCHVMARESFDSEEIAEILNKYFVSIKVDREQQPDVDEIYMTGVQIVSGRGGWPMSSFITPEGKPFFGATYFPPQQFMQLLQRVNNIWQKDEARLREDADKISQQIDKLLRLSQKSELSENAIESAVRMALKNYDAKHGGFSSAPKFPNESTLLFLLDQWRREDIGTLPDAIRHTLQEMASGGIYDQVGGGFHRYSTDTQWLVPHFEKMLYNQAMLSRVYGEAYQLTGEHYFSTISRETLDYVLRDMRDENGCFYSATDADSEGEEGVFFVWTPKQLLDALGEKDALWVMALYGVTEQGNFEDANILHLSQNYSQFAKKRNETIESVGKRLSEIKQKLYIEREKKVHPLRDEKIITAWNAMLITALAEGEKNLGVKEYLDAGEKCAEFLYKNHWDKDKKQLWRIGWKNKTNTLATQEDFAYFIEAMIALFDRTENVLWLSRARLLTEQMIVEFWDEEQGGFYFSSMYSDSKLISRAKSTGDGAIPSGGSVALTVLEKLWSRTGEFDYQKHYKETLASMSSSINRYPLGASYSLRAIDSSKRGESGNNIYMAEGHIKVTLSAHKLSDVGRFSITMNMDDGWHINADKLTTKELISTKIVADNVNWKIDSLVFPETENIQMSFLPAPLAVFQGKIVIEGRVTTLAENSVPIRLELTLQACEKGHCLAPETRVLTVPAQ